MRQSLRFRLSLGMSGRYGRNLMFESLEDRRLLAAANAEFLVELQTHGVPMWEQDLLDGLIHLEAKGQHLSLLVTPLDQYHKAGDGVSKDGDVAQEDPDFIYRSYYENFVLTIGAGSEHLLPPFGYLVPELNREPNDIVILGSATIFFIYLTYSSITTKTNFNSRSLSPEK